MTGTLGSRIRSDPVPFHVQHPRDDSKVLRGERIIRQLHLQCSTVDTDRRTQTVTSSQMGLSNLIIESTSLPPTDMQVTSVWGVSPGAHVVDVVLQGEVPALHRVAVQQGLGGQQTGPLFSGTQAHQSQAQKHVQHLHHLRRQDHSRRENKHGLFHSGGSLGSELK